MASSDDGRGAAGAPKRGEHQAGETACC